MYIYARYTGALNIIIIYAVQPQPRIYRLLLFIEFRLLAFAVHRKCGIENLCMYI